jgi:hypothetical protein
VHFNTRLAYERLFPQIDLDQKELSLSDLQLIADHFHKNLNFSSEKIKTFLLSLDREFRPTQYYKKAISIFVNPSNRAGGSEVTIEYWINRGWTETEAKSKISDIQKKRSVLCEDYWIARGMTQEDSKKMVSNKQRDNAKKSNNVFDRNYWISMGYSEEVSIQMVEEHKRKRSAWTVGFWVDRGFTEMESRDIIKKNARNTTLENLIERHGLNRAIAIKNDLEQRRNKFGFGDKNPQYGKSAPKGSGASVSGTYKSYYFRSLLEYFVIKHFEKNEIPFICNDVNLNEYPDKVVIPYQIRGTSRKYIPDFIVNGVEVWEVKNTYSLTTEEVQVKLSYANDFINTSDKLQTLKVVTERDVEMDQNELLDDVISGLVKIDTGKVQRFYKRIGKANESYLKEKIGCIAESI